MHYVLVLKHNIIKAGFFVTIYFYVWSAFTLMSLPDTMRVSSDHIYLASRTCWHLCVSMCQMRLIHCWSKMLSQAFHVCNWTSLTSPLLHDSFYAFSTVHSVVCVWHKCCLQCLLCQVFHIRFVFVLELQICIVYVYFHCFAFAGLEQSFVFHSTTVWHWKF